MKQLGVLIVVVLGLYLVYIFSAQKSDDSSSSFEQFYVEDIAQVQKIEIRSDRLETMTFEKKGSEWYLQRGHLARENAVNNLLEVIANLQIKYIPQAAANKNIEADMASLGIDVVVSDKAGHVLKQYVIGSSVADERGTYMKLKGAKQAYVTHLPTLEGSVRGRFLMRYDDWRDRTIFDVNTDDIVSVKVQYPRQESESFELNEDRVSSMSIADKQVHPTQKIDQYLNSFTNIVAEAYENINSNQDSIRQLLPFCIISLQLESEAQQTIKLYPIENYIDQSLVTLENTPRINRYFVDTSRGDFMLVQQRIIGKLLRGYSYFADDE